MNTDIQETYYPVIIAGGGPVGLYLGCLLYEYDIPFVIFEKREERINHSRSLGIHPVSLELFADLGIASRFVERGIKIQRGLAFTDNKKIGSISFESCPKPFNYILSLPQHITERLLEEHLNTCNPHALIRGAEVTGIEESDDEVTVNVVHSGKELNYRCHCLVGCDGKESFVRKSAGIPFEGSSYPDTYIMGDFSDNTRFENDAAVFLPKEGLIESFPLIGNRRRWVVKTENYIDAVNRDDLEDRIASRIGHDLCQEENFMLSSFGVQRLIAKPIARKRIALAGDAAHIVSPIGGQGMNLGWLDAAALGLQLKESVGKNNNGYLLQSLEEYSIRQRNKTEKVMRRAEWNMMLGRKPRFTLLRNAIVWLMLKTPLKKKVARLFTMRNLDGTFL